MEILHDKNFEQIKTLVASCGEKPFRAKQLFSSLNKGVKISETTDLSKEFRNLLLKNYYDFPCEIVEIKRAKDLTEKYLFRLTDGNVIEGVLMRYKYGNTLCVSTQVGCSMGCAFCASTLGGRVRNLSRGEMLSEVLSVNALYADKDKRGVTNIVLMGSGEPLDNYEETVGFLRLVSSPDGINISPRNISLSTCGLVDKMLALAEEDIPINLTLSLHAPTDEIRRKIMPIANKYSVAETIDACDRFFEKTSRRYYIEYSLIERLNDTEYCADKLCELLKGKPCHINLIRLNSVKERDLIGSSRQRTDAFYDMLVKRGLSVTVRRKTGADIDGACGQLRRKFLGEVD